MFRATTIMPDSIDTELTMGAPDAASRTFVDDFYKLAIPADSIARAIVRKRAAGGCGCKTGCDQAMVQES